MDCGTGGKGSEYKYMQILLDGSSSVAMFAFLCHGLYHAFAFDGFLLAFCQGSNEEVAGLTANSLQQF